MIIFNKISFKNFMSYGNVMTEIPLDNYHISVIVGRNGSGKSTIIAAICYALYGKPFNDANKSKIINSINGKNLLVELNINVNGIDYMIRRGQKPNIFEIYKNGNLIPQESSVHVYQDMLENQILKLNIKTLKQTILIGTASFTPFMELSANDRRAVIENVLGVEILSEMNQLVRVKESSNKNLIQEINTKINNIKIKINSEKDQIETITKMNNTNKEKYVQLIEEANKEIEETQIKVDQANAELEKLLPLKSKYDKVKELRNELKTRLSNINTLINKAKKELNFINSYESCPTCNQVITEMHKAMIKSKTDETIDSHKDEIEEISTKIKSYNELEVKLEKVIDTIYNININITKYNSRINYLSKSVKNYQTELDKPHESLDDINEHKQLIIELAQQAKDMLVERNKAVKESQLISDSMLLLKDNGIKSSIVNQYLPLINQKINQYLETFEFFLTVELDNQFNETIRARDRDIYSYQNLSQGERRRLDLAIILTWRYIISMRNDFNTNLLFVDELLESGLDADGIDSVMISLRNMMNTNIFIITHNQGIQDSRVDKYYKVSKENQFSVLEES